jgi:hypothetical protein
MVAGLMVVASMLACGAIRSSAVKAKTTNDLKQLGLAYHNFNDTNKRGPANMAEFQGFVVEPLEKTLVGQTGPGGQYVLIWGVKISDMARSPQGAGGLVLGYEAQAPTAGGMVLMGDASVRAMTAAEFNSAPKAQPGGGK